MAKRGYCSTCNTYFTLEDRVVGKVITMGLTGLITAVAHEDVKKNPLAFAGLNLAGLAIGHAIDQNLGFQCRTPGCTTMLKIVDAVMA